jgi:hypothetical protein
VYGPVRTVVWQGSAGDRRPYADRSAAPAEPYFNAAWSANHRATPPLSDYAVSREAMYEGRDC